jgi:hypothetical protein
MSIYLRLLLSDLRNQFTSQMALIAADGLTLEVPISRNLPGKWEEAWLDYHGLSLSFLGVSGFTNTYV